MIYKVRFYQEMPPSNKFLKSRKAAASNARESARPPLRDKTNAKDGDMGQEDGENDNQEGSGVSSKEIEQLKIQLRGKEREIQEVRLRHIPNRRNG